MFWNKSRIYIFFLTFKTLRAIVIYIYIFLIFFQSSFSDEKFIPFQLYLFIKCLIFVILSGYFFKFLHDLSRLLQRIKNICYLFFLMGFIVVSFFILFNQENLRMILHNLDLFYDIMQKINVIENKLTTIYWFQII